MSLIFLPDYLSVSFIREKYTLYANFEDGENGYYVTEEDYELNWKIKKRRSQETARLSTTIKLIY